MRTFKSYRLEHFFCGKNPLYSCQYFMLIDLINEEHTEREKAFKEEEKKSKRGKKR